MVDPLLERDGADLNFWPAFADLMLAVVFVLVLVLFGVAVSLMAGQVNIEHVEENQHRVMDEVADSFGSRVDTLGAGLYAIRLRGAPNTAVQIRNELNLQRITFSDRVLFAPDQYELNMEGRRVLALVGGVLGDHLDRIQEVQIQGHADTVPTRRHGSNVKLAALRAVEVFEYLQQEVEVDPASNLMSATSFGEYRPVERSVSDADFNADRLQGANSTVEQRASNRRIELLLFYRVE